MGNEIFPLMSAMQKTIRRGLDYEAIHFAIRLEEVNPSIVWSRLNVIASEDIGPANPLMPILVRTLEDLYWKFTQKQNKSRRLYLVNAIINLCRSKKSRDVDDLLISVYGKREYQKEKLKIPDYALDKHTSQGKAKNRGFKQFFDEGTKLENRADDSGRWSELAEHIATTYGSPSNPFKKEPIKSKPSTKLDSF